MVSLQEFSFGFPSDFSSEKKLAMILKTLLVIEAAAKVAFVVTIILMQKGLLLRRPRFNYSHVYHNSAVVVARLTGNYTLCMNADSEPAFIYITDW